MGGPVQGEAARAHLCRLVGTIDREHLSLATANRTRRTRPASARGVAPRDRRRLAAAGARCAPEDVLADLGRVVDVALDDHVRRLVVPLTVADGRLGASLGRVWAERVIVVERLVDELRRRLAARRWDEGDVELLRWATFVDAWRRAELVGHPTDVLALFDRAWQPLCDWAARADTIALERTLAHMVFSWMRPRMPWDQDDERRKLIANNWLVTR